MLERFLFSYLQALGLPFGSRIYPFVLPQSVTLPALTYQVISDSGYNDLSGSINYRQPRVQLDIYHSSLSGANTLAGQLIQAIRANRRPAYTGVDFVTILAHRSIFEPNTLLYRYIIDISVTYNDTEII